MTEGLKAGENIDLIRCGRCGYLAKLNQADKLPGIWHICLKCEQGRDYEPSDIIPAHVVGDGEYELFVCPTCGYFGEPDASLAQALRLKFPTTEMKFACFKCRREHRITHFQIVRAVKGGGHGQ